MGSSAPAAPTPPDPVATASAQSTANAQTATAQAALNNVNQYTPYGSLSYQQTGTQTITNPDGTTTEVPTFTSTQTLSPTEQNLFDQQASLGSQENTVAGNALTNIGGVLSHPLTQSQLPGLTTSLGAQPNLLTSYDPGGAIQTGYSQGGPIQTSVPVTQTADTFGGTANQVQGTLGNTDFTQATNDATNAALARLQPQMDQSNAALDSKLANEGITAGSSAYNDAMLQQAGANNDLRLGAVQTGDQEQQALFNEADEAGTFANAAQAQEFAQAQNRGLFGMQADAQNNAANLSAGEFANAAQLQGNTENADEAAFANAAQGQQNSENQALAGFTNAALEQGYQNQDTSATFANQAREQALSDGLQLRNAPINEVSALMNGGQATNGQYQGYNAAQLGSTPISQDTYASANLAEQNYQSEEQAAAQNNSAMFSALGGLFGMGANYIGGKVPFSSDIRLKKDITSLGYSSNGLPAYSYRYVWDADDALKSVGHLAQEVMLTRPDAVFRLPCGFLAVDYPALAA